MADYKELIRRAVEALPENNGAARRAVYEKARAALVGQLRGHQSAAAPPGTSRTHRLQLEDCIRQVEQEASEASHRRHRAERGATGRHAAAGLCRRQAARKRPVQRPPRARQVAAKAAARRRRASRPRHSRAGQPTAPPNSIEAIIAAAERDRAEPRVAAQGRRSSSRGRRNRSRVLVAKTDPPPYSRSRRREPSLEASPADRLAAPTARPLPSIVARAEAAKGRARGADVRRSRRRTAAAAEDRAAPRWPLEHRGRAPEPRAGCDEPRRDSGRCRRSREVEVEQQPQPIRRARSTAPSRRSIAGCGGEIEPPQLRRRAGL